MGRRETLIMIYVKKYPTGFNEVTQIKEQKEGLRNKVPDFKRE